MEALQNTSEIFQKRFLMWEGTQLIFAFQIKFSRIAAICIQKKQQSKQLKVLQDCSAAENIFTQAIYTPTCAQAELPKANKHASCEL